VLFCISLTMARRLFVVNQDTIDEIIAAKPIWKPAEPNENKFNGWTVDQIQGLLGARIDQTRVASMQKSSMLLEIQELARERFQQKKMADFVNSTNSTEDTQEHSSSGNETEGNKTESATLGRHRMLSTPTGASLPDNFDWRTAMPGCVRPIRNQGKCGGCWSFAASEMLGDRFFIASKGAINITLSPQNMLSCEADNFGCGGGYLGNSMNYLVNTGIVTDTCYPYTSINSTTSATCGKASTCTATGQTWKPYKCLANTIVFPSTEATIKAEIMANGPVETGYLVYDDFMNYKSGIYSYVSGNMIGGHAVKIVGWGLDAPSGVKYWICSNSWGADWGENGFFRIVIGNCQINLNVFACSPNLSS